MKERFHAVDKTAELLDRLIKEQYEAGEAAVAHDLSQLRGIMLPYSMTDRHVSDMWLRGLEEKKRQERNGFPRHDVIVRGGINMFNKVAKEFTKVSDEELNSFLEDKVDTTNVQTFIQSAVDGVKDFGYEVVGFEQTFEDLGGAEITEETTISPVPYLPDAFSPMFPISRVTNDVSGLPKIAYRPFGDPQQLTEQCLKCRGTGLNSLRERCQRCKGSGYAR